MINISYFHQDFFIEMQNTPFNKKQQFIFNIINNSGSNLYFEKKKILLCAPTDATTTRLPLNANTTYGHFELPSKGLFYAFQYHNLTLQRLQSADAIIGDKISMITLV